MIKVLEEGNCTGCTACMNICPKKAITMETDSQGFKHPVINQEECINCGLCKKTCPVINTKDNTSLNKCYVGYNKDEKSLMNKASSGSIFELIAKEILKDNGIVIGAAFDKNMKLNHIAITEEKDLIKLKGSKYLQSNLGNIFKDVKDNINDKKILFVGTPCQVAGLKAYLKKDYENLLSIDLLCHGAPSPKLFDKYIKELEIKNNSKVINYNFRDKSTGWDTYSNTITFANTKELKQLQRDNNYMKLFLSDIALRESCYNCNFKLGNKYSDITLGDFWGINNYYPEMYNKKGVSAIIINTEKGKDVFNKVTKNIEHKECKLDEIVSGNPSLKVSSKYSNKRKKFFKDLNNNDFEKIVNKYTKKTMFSKIKRTLKKVLNIKKNKIKKM